MAAKKKKLEAKPTVPDDVAVATEAMRARLQQTVDELASHPEVTLDMLPALRSAPVAKPRIVQAELAEFEAWAAQHGATRARAEVGALLPLLWRANLGWRVDPDPEHAGSHRGGGEIAITLWPSWATPYAGDPSWSVLDDQPRGGTGEVGLVRIEGGSFRCAFFRHEALPMDVDLAGYLAAAIDLRGWYGWQLLFCDVDLGSLDLSVAARGLARGLRRLEELFPRVSLEVHRERFRARGGVA